MDNNEAEWFAHVTKIWERKPDPALMTTKEYEQVYRYHFTHIDDADEDTLYHLIERFHQAHVLNPRWLGMLLIQFPSDLNWNIFTSFYPPTTRKFKSVLVGLIDMPKISCETLRLIERRARVTGRRQFKEKIVHQKALKRLGQREFDSFDPGI